MDLLERYFNMTGANKKRKKSNNENSDTIIEPKTFDRLLTSKHQDQTHIYIRAWVK